MTLQAVQQFLTDYQRDPAFRARFREAGTALLPGLDDEERRLVSQLNLDRLDHRAEATRAERMTRSGGVFARLYNHLDPYVDMERFFVEFDRTHTRGWWQRRAEIRRIESFVLDFVADNGLPEYLIDICRFCSQTTTVAETPKTSPPGHVDLPGLTSVQGSYQIALRKPYEIAAYRYDVLELLPDENPSTPPQPVATRLLIQRDWRQHKRSRVFTLADEPVLAALAHGPATLFELGGLVPQMTYRALRDAIADLSRRSVVHLIVPAEIAGDVTPPPDRSGGGVSTVRT